MQAEKTIMQTCERCQRELHPDRVVLLELNCTNNRWTTTDKPWPEKESQGCFTFGPGCAAAALEKGWFWS